MFKQAVDSHQAQATKRALAQQLFPSSSPPSQPQFKPFKPPTPCSQRSRPLSEGTGNILRTAAVRNVSTFGIKRTSSGLEKAVDRRDAFEELPRHHHNPQQNPIIINDVSPVKKNHAQLDGAVYFDENDFDSDIDLDVEDPATKGSVSYPELPPPSAPVTQTIETSTTTAFHGSRNHPPQTVSYPTLPKAASRVRDWEERSDSGYVSQIPASYREQPPPPSSEPLPWSSSPAEHYKPPPGVRSIRQFTYTGSNVSTVSITSNGAEPRPTASKRRTLPWLDQEIKEEAPSAPVTAQSGRQKKSGAPGGDYTPLPKNNKKSEYPWNTTASAIKQQQKTLRETNRKLIKAHEGTNESIKAAFEDRKRKTVHRPFLSDEQQHVLDLVVEHKKSVFFTGSAGTGKSVLLREIIASLRKKYAREPDRVAVTASTGLAACNVGGVTLHSFAGFGLGKDAVPELVKKIKRNQKARHRWMRTKVLVIDEVSMVDGDFFDKLEEIARIIRNNGRPFGGIQLVITGDFFQLPPVPDYGKAAKFCFDAGTWNTSIEHTIGLHHVFRQKDPVFAAMLNEMREGRLSQKSINAFRQLSRDVSWEDGMEATELFPTRNEVDAANNRRMQLLVGDTKVFQARDGGTMTDKKMRDKLLSSCMAPDEIHLKKGAQVMLIKNIDDTLVNGSLGKVIGFMSEQTFDKYHEDEEAFLSTQAAGDEDLNPQERKLKSQLEIMASTAQQYPVVRFAIADGTTRDLLCQRETWKVELPNGEVQASRAQVPLILAWALSIHKAQGQTLERVKVDLGKVFEKGQAYVALSRATSMAGLQVLRFDPAKVMAHERVRNFYARLSRAETTEGGPVVQPAKKSKLTAQEYEKSFVGDEFADEQEALAAYG